MLYVDIPAQSEFKTLVETRADACVSLYLKTTPMSQEAGASQIELGNLTKQALGQLDAVSFDKRKRAAIEEQLQDLMDDPSFWNFQANSLAVLVTPENIHTFRLPNKLTPSVEVSDRYHLKPLLRAITFPHGAYVLALSENAVRLVEVFAELPAAPVRVSDLPKDAASSTNRASADGRSPRGRLQGSEGEKVRLRQYARQVDAALRPLLSGQDTPLVLAATEPLASIYRGLNSYPGLATEVIATNPDRMSDAELAKATRPILDGIYAEQLKAIKALFDKRTSENRTTTDIAHAARAATCGAIDQLLVDIDDLVPGTIDAEGNVSIAKEGGALLYGVVDEIAGRAIQSGATVLGVRRDDIPNRSSVAAILRYPF